MYHKVPTGLKKYPLVPKIYHLYRKSTHIVWCDCKFLIPLVSQSVSANHRIYRRCGILKQVTLHEQVNFNLQECKHAYMHVHVIRTFVPNCSL